MTNVSLAAWITAIKSGRYFYIGDPDEYITSYVHVDDVVHALIICSGNSRSHGEIYNISDQLSQRKFVELVNSNYGILKETRTVNKLLIQIGISLGTFIPNFPLTQSRYHSLTDRTIYSSEKIINQLNYKYKKSMRDGLIDFMQNLPAG